MLGISNSRILAPAVGLYSPPTLSVASDTKLAIMAWMALRGEAKAICRHMEIEDLSLPTKGLQQLLAFLDARYLRQPHEEYDSVADRYEKFRRRVGQTMQELACIFPDV